LKTSWLRNEAKQTWQVSYRTGRNICQRQWA